MMRWPRVLAGFAAAYQSTKVSYKGWNGQLLLTSMKGLETS
jgi:hypothetical protein